MKSRQIIKIITDIVMMVILLLLTAYSLVGEEAHEWLGIVMFVLFVFHHVLNNKWSRAVFKGKYTSYRILQTVLAVAVFLSMIGSMVSGVALSRYALDFLPVAGGLSWARTLHMLSAYWGFIFISLHIGLHWSIMMNMAKRLLRKPSAVRSWLVRIIGFLIAVYGIYAFIKREIGSYMLLRSHFVFFDFDEPLFFFMLDYIAVMCLFALIGHYLTEGFKSVGKKKTCV